MMNSHMPYYPPHLHLANQWMNLNPEFIGVTEEGTVSAWKNAIDSRSTFSQATEDNQPTFSPAATASAVVFDGDDWLGSGLDTRYDTGDGGWTVVFRHTSDDWTVNDAVMGNDDNNNSFIRNNGNSGMTVKAYNAAEAAVITKGITINNPLSGLVDETYYNFIIQCDPGAGNMDLWVNGIEQTSSPTLGR